MQLRLRSYLGSKELRLLRILLIVVQCQIHSGEKVKERNNEFCPGVALKCIKPSADVFYSPKQFKEVCATDKINCKLFANPCELEKAKCKGEGWKEIETHLCKNLNIGGVGECNCPLVKECWPETNPLCGRYSNQCKYFKDNCEFEMQQCIFQEWKLTTWSDCCDFQIGEENSCALDKTKEICATRDNKKCRLFPTKCDLLETNRRLSPARRWTQRNGHFCKCISDFQIEAPCNCGKDSEII